MDAGHGERNALRVRVKLRETCTTVEDLNYEEIRIGFTGPGDDVAKETENTASKGLGKSHAYHVELHRRIE